MHVMAGSIPGAGMFAPQASGMVHLQRRFNGQPFVDRFFRCVVRAAALDRRNDLSYILFISQ